MKISGIVFDKDGTLLDFNKTWLPVYQAAAIDIADGDPKLAAQLLATHGYDAINHRFLSGSLLAAGNNRQIAEAWAEQLDQISQLETLSTRLNAIFNQQGARYTTPVDKLQTTLAQLKRMGLKLGVATADSHAGIINTLQAFDVLHYFDFLAGFDSGYGCKPAGGMVTAFCQQMRLEPTSVVVVGDNRHDIEMGRNARVELCIGVLTGTSTHDDLAPFADHILDDISALPEVISLL